MCDTNFGLFSGKLFLFPILQIRIFLSTNRGYGWNSFCYFDKIFRLANVEKMEFVKWDYVQKNSTLERKNSNITTIKWVTEQCHTRFTRCTEIGNQRTVTKPY